MEEVLNPYPRTEDDSLPPRLLTCSATILGPASVEPATATAIPSRITCFATSTTCADKELNVICTIARHSSSVACMLLLPIQSPHPYPLPLTQEREKNTPLSPREPGGMGTSEAPKDRSSH